MDAPYDPRLEEIKNNPKQLKLYIEYIKASSKDRAEKYQFYKKKNGQLILKPKQ